MLKLCTQHKLSALLRYITQYVDCVTECPSIVVHATVCGLCYIISTLLWHMPPCVECIIQYLHYCGTCHSVWTVLYNIHTIMVHVTLCGVCYTVSAALWYALMLVSMLCDL